MTPDIINPPGNPRLVTAGEINEQHLDSYYSELWTWTVKTTDAGTSGQVGLNAATWESATMLNINDQQSTNRDMSIAIQLLFVQGYYALLQHKTDATRYALYRFSANAVDKTTWWQCPVIYNKSSGPIFAGNTSVVVTIFVSPIVLP